MEGGRGATKTMTKSIINKVIKDFVIVVIIIVIIIIVITIIIIVIVIPIVSKPLLTVDPNSWNVISSGVVIGAGCGPLR